MRLLRLGMILLAAVAAGSAAGPAFAVPAGAAQAVPAKAYGPDFSLPSTPRRQDAVAADITEYDLSLGCILGGTTGTALSVTAGGMNVVNLIAGGLVPAASPVAMWVALGGVVFASFCSVGQALTPAAMATYAYFVPPAAPAFKPTVPVDARYCQAALPLPAPSGIPQSLPVRLHAASR